MSDETVDDSSPLAQKVLRWAGLFDFRRLPDSKLGWYVRFGVTLVALLLLWRRLVHDLKPMITARPPPPVPNEQIEDYRFNLPERTRRAMFTEIAAAELAERARAIAANSWGGHKWSREDDRGHYERVALRAVAAKYKISLTQAYLVLDEGLRNHWPAPDGNPLPATTPALDIRRNSW